MRLVLAHVREQRAAVGVADRVQPGVAVDAHGVVDVEVLTGLQADRVQPDLGRGGPAADGDEQLIPRELTAVLERERHLSPAAGPGDRAGPDVGEQRHAVRAQAGADLLPGERLLAGEHARPGLDQRDRRAQRRVGLGELDADDAAAEHEQPRRHGARGRRLSVAPRVGLGKAGDGWHRGDAAGGDDDGAPRAQHVVARAHEPFAGQAPVRAHERDTALLQPRQLRGVVKVVDDVVAAAQHGTGIERAGHRLAHAGHALRLGEQLRRAQQRLGRHAGIERALPADEPRLDDRGRVPALRDPTGQRLPRRTGPDDDDVEFALGHASWSLRCRVRRPPGQPAAIIRHPRGCSSVG